MKKNIRRCEICKIKHDRIEGKRKFMARFPLKEDVCKLWVKVTGNEDLAYIPIEKLHQLKFICGDHFNPKDFNAKRTQLKKGTVPSCSLPLKPLPDHILADFPCRLATSEDTCKYKVSASVFVDHNYCDLQFKDVQVLQPEPSAVLIASDLNIQSDFDNHDTAAVDDDISQFHEEDSLRPSGPFDSTTKSPDVIPVTNHKNRVKHPEGKILVHSVSAPSGSGRQGKRSRNAEDADSPRVKKLLKSLKASKENLKRLKKKTKLLDCLEENPFLKALVTCTATNKNRKHQAKRWSNTIKVFALTLLKMSPEVYKYVQQLIPLPSVRTLQVLLKKITLEPNMNCEAIVNESIIDFENQEI